jgi:hypothetical protein
MKKMIGSMIAVAGLAAAAHAQPLATQLRYEVRPFDAGNDNGWASSIDVLPGTRVEVRALVSYTGTGTVGGLGQIVFQPIVSNWGAGDALVTNSMTGQTGPADGIGPVGGTRSTPMGTVSNLPGVYGRITPWGANATSTSTYLRGHAGTGTAAGMLRIAQNHITNWIGVGATSGSTANNNQNGGGGVSIAQIASPARLTSDPPFDNRSSNILVFKFSFTLGADPSARTLSINTPENGFNRTLVSGQYVPNIRWFASEQEATPSIQTAAAAVAGNVNVVPTPGALALLGLGGLVAARRRR